MVILRNLRDWMKRAILDLKLGPEKSDLVYRSLEPELQRDDLQTNVAVTVEGEHLKLDIEASELSNLRAALNSYIRWINCIHSINDVIDDNK
jgi:tRNA threonylcarbamoyladenosine modification (KEOPS) complex  Pcc1 subunit